MADSVARGGDNCANEEIGQDKRVSEVSEVKGQGAAVDRSSEETNSTTATPVSYSREGYLESSGNYSAAGGCFNPTVEALQVRVHCYRLQLLVVVLLHILHLHTCRRASSI